MLNTLLELSNMKPTVKTSLWVSAIIVAAVVIDQAIKLYIRTHYALGESYQVTSWFYLCFVENDGMAFGIEWFNKIFLTLFRIAAVGVIGWYIHKLILSLSAVGDLSAKRSFSDSGLTAKRSYLVWVALVMAGAIGNIVDCVCYGKLFGYAGWFYGKVVDMFYFPLITNSAGECIFFRPVFNFADSCITVAVIVIILFYRKELNQTLEKK